MHARVAWWWVAALSLLAGVLVWLLVPASEPSRGDPAPKRSEAPVPEARDLTSEAPMLAGKGVVPPGLKTVRARVRTRLGDGVSRRVSVYLQAAGQDVRKVGSLPTDVWQDVEVPRGHVVWNAHLTTTGDGREPHYEEVELRREHLADDEEVDLLLAAGTVRLRVVALDAEGRGVAGVRVGLDAAQGAKESARETDERGEAVWEGLRRSVSRCEDCIDVLRQPSTIDVLDARTATWSADGLEGTDNLLCVRCDASVFAEFRDYDGGGWLLQQRLADGTWSTDRRRGWIGTVRDPRGQEVTRWPIEQRGTYTVEGSNFAPGPYRLTVVFAEGRVARAEFELTSGERTRVVEFQPLAVDRVPGRLVGVGVGTVRHLVVTLHPPPASAAQSLAIAVRVGPDGGFAVPRLDLLPTVRITGYADQGHAVRALPRAFDLGRAGTLEVETAACARLEGRVVDAAGAAVPRARVRVVARPADRAAWAYSHRDFFLEELSGTPPTDSEGRFRTPLTFPGLWEVEAQAPENPKGRRTKDVLPVGAADSPREVELRLP